MTPRTTLNEINNLILQMVQLGLSNEQNFPSTKGDSEKMFEITIGNASALTIALKNLPYDEIYREIEQARAFNVKMLDGALITFRYRFCDGVIAQHLLSFYPSPSLNVFQSEPDLYTEDQTYADVVSRNVVPFPIRFDYQSDPAKFVEIYHPYSHLTLGQYANCRIPVCSPVGPLIFGEFLLRNFYDTKEEKYSNQLPAGRHYFPSTITANEENIPHMVLRA